MSARQRAVDGVLAQLRNPNPVARDLALYRTRVYRFSNDPRHYALAEDLEERHIAGLNLRPATLAYVRASLDAIRADGHVPAFDTKIAHAEGIDIGSGLRDRETHTLANIPMTAPTRVTAIVGAPRSGTSHLLNLLALYGRFAYFTTVSCWAWPTRNLTRPGRTLFSDIGSRVTAVDNKKTRLIPELVMPYEAEDVLARALPVYDHIAGHHYNLKPVTTGQTQILHRSVAAHLAHFGSRHLLIKSPFNSLRIPALEQVWGPKITYLHMVRDQRETAGSMQRNGFKFSTDGHVVTSHEACAAFNTGVEGDAPDRRTIKVNHQELTRNPQQLIHRILNA